MASAISVNIYVLFLTLSQGVYMSFLKFMMNEDVFYPDLTRMPGGCLPEGVRPTYSASPPLRRPSDRPEVEGEACINRLPPEILSLIFISCLERGGFMWPAIIDPPLLFTLVCRSWYQVAIATPQLWNSLMLVLPPKVTLVAFSYGAPVWLSRSGVLPMSIRLDAHPIFTFPADLFNIFVPFFEQWRTLKLHIPSSALVHLINHPMAWARLTTFVLSSDASLQDAISILSLCRNLRSCSFLRIMETSVPTPPSEPIVLPEMLWLKMYGREDIYVILDCLETPQLQTLEIYFYWPQPWQKYRLLSMFERSGCPLTKLVLEGVDIPAADIMDCTKRIPDLLEFETLFSGQNLITQEVLGILTERRRRKKDAGRPRS